MATTITRCCSRTLPTPGTWKPWAIAGWKKVEAFGICAKGPPIDLSGIWSSSIIPALRKPFASAPTSCWTRPNQWQSCKPPWRFQEEDKKEPAHAWASLFFRVEMTSVLLPMFQRSTFCHPPRYLQVPWGPGMHSTYLVPAMASNMIGGLLLGFIGSQRGSDKFELPGNLQMIGLPNHLGPPTKRRRSGEKKVDTSLIIEREA